MVKNLNADSQRFSKHTLMI